MDRYQYQAELDQQFERLGFPYRAWQLAPEEWQRLYDLGVPAEAASTQIVNRYRAAPSPNLPSASPQNLGITGLTSLIDLTAYVYLGLCGLRFLVFTYQFLTRGQSVGGYPFPFGVGNSFLEVVTDLLSRVIIAMVALGFSRGLALYVQRNRP